MVQPFRYQERRVENIRFISDTHVEVEVVQQVWLPTEQFGDDVPPTLLVPLGLFSKSRLPTLRAFDSSGTELPILSRQERARVLATLFLNKYLLALLEQSVPPNDVATMQRQLLFLVGRVITAGFKVSRQAREDVLGVLTQDQRAEMQALGNDAEFRHELASLAKTTTVLARIPRPASHQVVLRYTFQTRTIYNRLIPDQHWSIRRAAADAWRAFKAHRFMRSLLFGARFARNTLVAPLNRLFIAVSLFPTIVNRRVINADHCDSYYFLLTVPRGLFVQRGYWLTLEAVSPHAQLALEGELWHGQPFVLAAHSSHCTPRSGDNTLYVEFRLARSIGNVTAWLLAGASTALASVVVFSSIHGDTRFRFLATISALPGALVGVLSREATAESKRVTRVPLALGFLVSALALAMGIAGVTAATLTPVVSGFAVWTAIVGFFLFLLLGWSLGPSWFFDGPRRPDATRRSALRRVRTEKVVGAMYFAGMLAATVAFGLALRS